YNASLGKMVGAKYAGSIYHEIQHDNGDRYVLTCRPEKLREYEHRLMRMLNLLRKRVVFITSGSRRIFGIIGEPSVCIVCDCKTSDSRLFNQFQSSIISLLKEQVTKIKRFNVVWVSNDNEQFQQQPIDVTTTTIDEAIAWISNRKCIRTKISISATCEAILKAFNNAVHSIYLISEGNSTDSAREMLRDNIVKTRLSAKAPIPIHVVSLFCHNEDTEIFLQSLAQSADGSFTSYKINNSVIDLKAPSNLTDPTRIKVQDNKLEFGTTAVIPKFENPSDLTLMYKEILQCQNIIDRIEKILGFIKAESVNPKLADESTKSFDSLNVTNKLNKTENNLQRSLIVQSSALFNNDEKDLASVDWLKIYGVQSQKLDFFSVLQSVALRHCDGVITSLKQPEDSNRKTNYTPAEQLFGKERINLVSFNTVINPWRDRLTKINNSIINTQLQPWIDGLHTEGSTNTLAAIRYALADSGTDGIYLLTDGRPDQNERHILSQVQYRQTLPIHTIAFNCQDQTANQFLFDLAKQTGGRFHAFNYGDENEASIEIPESEDINYLKQEIILGEKDLQRVTDLRDECTSRAWSKDNIQATYQNLQSPEIMPSLPLQRHHTLNTSLQSNSCK
ncbi:unnamed protein product, partial [Rotaria socialis]